MLVVCMMLMFLVLVMISGVLNSVLVSDVSVLLCIVFGMLCWSVIGLLYVLLMVIVCVVVLVIEIVVKISSGSVVSMLKCGMLNGSYIGCVKSGLCYMLVSVGIVLSV